VTKRNAEAKQRQKAYYGKEPDKICCMCLEDTSHGKLLAYAHEGDACCTARVHSKCWKILDNPKHDVCPKCRGKLEEGNRKNVDFEIIIEGDRRNELQNLCRFEFGRNLFKVTTQYSPPLSESSDGLAPPPDKYLYPGDYILKVVGEGSLEWLSKAEQRELIFAPAPKVYYNPQGGCFCRERRTKALWKQAQQTQHDKPDVTLKILREMVFSKLHTETQARKILVKKEPASIRTDLTKLEEYRKKHSEELASIFRVGLPLLGPYFGFYSCWMAIFFFFVGAIIAWRKVIRKLVCA